MTRCSESMAAPVLLCCLLVGGLASAATSSGASYSPSPRYGHGPSPLPSAYRPPSRGAYGLPPPVGPYGSSSAQPNQRFFLPDPFKGIFDKFNIFNKGPIGGYPSPLGGFNPFAGLCNPGGGSYTAPGGGYTLPKPPGYNPPSSDPVYAPPSSSGHSGNRPIVIYTRPSTKSPYNKPSYDAPDRNKPMITSRPHPIYG